MSDPSTFPIKIQRLLRRKCALPVILGVSSISFTSSTSAELLSPWVINPEDGHSYALLVSTNWASSENEAVSLGGHLATIRNQAEQDWVFNLFGGYGGNQHLLWIGLNDAALEGDFVWSSGEAVTYTHWATGEPNNANGNEDYVAMYYPNHSEASYWNDWGVRKTDPIGIPMNGVVEIIPEPGALALCAVGLTALFVSRRRKVRRGSRWSC